MSILARLFLQINLWSWLFDIRDIEILADFTSQSIINFAVPRNRRLLIVRQIYVNAVTGTFSAQMAIMKRKVLKQLSSLHPSCLTKT